LESSSYLIFSHYIFDLAGHLQVCIFGKATAVRCNAVFFFFYTATASGFLFGLCVVYGFVCGCPVCSWQTSRQTSALKVLWLSQQTAEFRKQFSKGRKKMWRKGSILILLRCTEVVTTARRKDEPKSESIRAEPYFEFNSTCTYWAQISENGLHSNTNICFLNNYCNI
jgi:hypothetical protein